MYDNITSTIFHVRKKIWVSSLVPATITHRGIQNAVCSCEYLVIFLHFSTGTAPSNTTRINGNVLSAQKRFRYTAPYIHGSVQAGHSNSPQRNGSYAQYILLLEHVKTRQRIGRIVILTGHKLITPGTGYVHL